MRKWLANRISAGVRTLITIVAVGAFASTASDLRASGNGYQPVLQVIPSIHASRRPQAFLDACFNMSQWPTVLANATYLGAHGDLRDTVDEGTLVNCFAQMNARGLQLTLEVGSVKAGCPDGGNCYSNNYFHWSRLRELGAPLTVLRMDEPMYAVMTNPWFGGNGNMAYAIAKTADWIQQVRANFPGMRIVDIEPYPAGLGGHTLASWITGLRNECNYRGIACPEVFELDYDPDLPGGSVSEIKNLLVPTVHGVGEAFAYIYTNTRLTADSTDNCTFNQAGVNRAAALAFAPDWFTVESWSPNPTTTVPETGGGCTLTSAAKVLIDLDYYPSKTAVLFDSSNFKGDGFGAPIGDMPFVGWEWNDRTGSLRIPAGVSVSLYQDSNFGGTSISFTGPANIPSLAVYAGPGPDGTWNDSVSSIKVFLGGPPPPPPSGDYTIIMGGSSLGPEQSWASPNGRFVLKYQNDGNLVLYDNGAAAWAINCWPGCSSTGFQGNAFQPAGYTTMQSDGNLVTYNSSGGPVWHASTFGNPGAYLAIGNDGSLVIHRSDGSVLWQR